MPPIANWTRLSCLCAALTLLAAPLKPTSLLPGDTGIVPEAFPDPGNVPLLDSVNGVFGYSNGTDWLTGRYFEAVVVDPLGITCAGCLDFALRVTVDAGLPSGLTNAALGGFWGYTTDVGYLEGTGAMGAFGGNGVPRLVNRGAGGGGVNFRFVSPGNFTPVGSGGTSAILVVATNATTYDKNGFLVIGGFASNSSTGGDFSGLLEPTVLGTPEPSTGLLLGIGLAALSAFSIRRGSRELPVIAAGTESDTARTISSPAN
jgi:hypothetical protein